MDNSPICPSLHSRRHSIFFASPLLGTIAAVLCGAAVVLLFSLSGATGAHQAPPPGSLSVADDDIGRDYYVVVDAGSTGSRVFVFSRPIDGGEVSYVEYPRGSGTKAVYAVVPGLSSFAERPQDAYDGGFGLLLEYAAQVVPEHAIPHTPLYVRGTAGLRRLTKEHRLAIFDELLARTKRDYLFQVADGHEDAEAAEDATAAAAAAEGNAAPLASSSGANDSSSSSRSAAAAIAAAVAAAPVPTFGVLSGTMEGICAWLAINHEEGRLGSSPGDTFGAVDMGGSSSQLVFAVATSDTRSGNPLRGRDIHEAMGFDLYSHSFPRTGMSAMWDVYIQRQVGGKDGVAGMAGKQLESPCLHAGQTLGLVCGERDGDFTCVHTDDRGQLGGATITEVMLMGTGDFLACKAAFEGQVCLVSYSLAK
jgi:hypothetical protein